MVRQKMVDRIKILVALRYTRKEIGRIMGVSEDEISKICDREGIQRIPASSRKWRERRISREKLCQWIKRLASEGLTQKEIAKETGYSLRHLQKICRQEGIRTKRATGPRNTSQTDREPLLAKIRYLAEEEGLTQTEIAAEIKRSHSNLQKLCNQNKILTQKSDGPRKSIAERIQRWVGQGFTQEETARLIALERPGEVEEIRELRRSGFTRSEIADMLGCSVVSINTICRLFKVGVRSQKEPISLQKTKDLISQGLTLQDIADQLGRSEGSVRKFLRKNNLRTKGMIRTVKPKTRIEVETVSLLVDRGLSQAEIAKQLNCSSVWVGSLCRKHGLRSKTKKGAKTKIKVEDVRSLIKRGLSQAEIAKELNCSQGGVSVVCRKHGLKTKIKRKAKSNNKDSS